MIRRLDRIAVPFNTIDVPRTEDAPDFRDSLFGVEVPGVERMVLEFP